MAQDIAMPLWEMAAEQPTAPEAATETPLPDILPSDATRPRERFIPVTTYALIDRLTTAQAWPGGQARQARRFFRYLDYWRRQQHSVGLANLLQAYEALQPG